MGKKLFNEKVLRGVSDFLKGEAKVTLKRIVKNNGVELDGLVITQEGNNLSPTIYLNSFYDEYGQGKTLGSIVYEVVKLYDANKISNALDMNFYTDYAKVRNSIFCKIINYDKNSKLLEDVPHVRFLDLAAVCYYSYMNDFLGNGTILIRTSHQEKWKVEAGELFTCAFDNTREKLGYNCKEMHEVIQETFTDSIGASLEKYLDGIEEEEREQLSEEWKSDIITYLLCEMEERSRERPMYILTNNQRFLGASCLLFSEILEEVGRRISANFYILPSSIHELILVPDSGKESKQILAEMVSEVNNTQVEPEEILSYGVYYYDRQKKETMLL